MNKTTNHFNPEGLNSYPTAVKNLPFCCWRIEMVNGRKTKVPYNPKTGQKPHVDNDSTFTDFQSAMDGVEHSKYLSGIGVKASGNVGFIEIDGCLEHGTLSELASQMLNMLPDAFAEKSPSGTGLHLMFLLPENFSFDKSRYGNKSRHFNFIRLPQVLFTDELFRPLSSDTKILYALLLDRTTLSIKKHWLDSEGRVYINFPISEISAKIGVGTQKAVKLMRELENFGLIERVRIGLGKPDRIYVKHCGRSTDNADEPTNETALESRNNDDVGIVESVETVGADVSISPF